MMLVHRLVQDLMDLSVGVFFAVLVAGMWGGILYVLTPRTLRYWKWAIPLCIASVVFVAAAYRVNQEAMAQGFQNSDDRSDAIRNGFSNPAEWRQAKSRYLARVIAAGWYEMVAIWQKSGALAYGVQTGA